MSNVPCKPVVPHAIKMYSKKLLRSIHSHSDGWRALAESANEETIIETEKENEDE